MPMKPPIHGQAERQQRRREAERACDARRGTSAARGYDGTWRKLRQVFIRQNPLCAMCMQQGRIVPAKEVDHIRPHRGDNALRMDWDNLQALCKPCHSRKTASENGGFGNG